ncbi:MAG: hypothetical protein GX126_13255 [Bacteroidales bacterium]|nr:hypothetical protein [Bacteroidales bacterium]
MILFYTEKLNPRIEYAAKLIFTDILKIGIRITTNSAEFLSSGLPKVNYSNERFGNEFFIKPNSFLFYKSISKPVVTPLSYNGEHCFFESSGESDLPFDPFAGAFYFVTRFEEYIETVTDNYNRYPSHKSILSEYNLLKKPVVNIWARMLSGKLKERYPAIEIPGPEFKFFSTIDVDNAWGYAHKGFIRCSGALMRAVLKGNFIEAGERLKVLTGIRQDPFYTYPLLDEVFKDNEDRVIFFFPLGDYGRYDKNISWKNRNLQELIRNTSAKYSVGIHPSYSSESISGERLLKTEISRFSKITGTKPEKSRQHYVRLRLPETYRRLIDNGIREDYTMGYASQTGFRAGICTPFCFYDLNKDMVTPLKIFPFQVMDVTLHDYLGMTPDQANEEIEILMNEVKKAGGTFISIWHNESLSGRGNREGYREVFYKMNERGFNWSNE